MLAEAETQVNSYIAASRDPEQSATERAAQQEAAYGALEAFVTINIAPSKTAQQDASRWAGRAPAACFEQPVNKACSDPPWPVSGG